MANDRSIMIPEFHERLHHLIDDALANHTALYDIGTELSMSEGSAIIFQPRNLAMNQNERLESATQYSLTDIKRPSLTQMHQGPGQQKQMNIQQRPGHYGVSRQSQG